MSNLQKLEPKLDEISKKSFLKSIDAFGHTLELSLRGSDG